MNFWWLQQADFSAWIALLAALFIGHALADYALQSEFMAKAKNRHQPPPPGNTPADFSPTLWVFVLSAHCAIHAGMVWALTACGWLGLAEFCLHWIIDWLRAEGRLGFHADQLSHLACKAAYVAALALS
jgi:hypothetical protein